MKILTLKVNTSILVLTLLLSFFARAQDGIRGVVNLGSNGWLFQSEELTGFDKNYLPDFVSKLKFFDDYLGKSGTKIVYVIIPTKYEIYGKFELNKSKISDESYEIIGKSLKEAGLKFLDAKYVLKKAAEGGSLVWMRRDTHMSPQGGQILGKNIAHYLTTNQLVNITHKNNYTIDFQNVDFPSDLWRFIYPKDQLVYPKFESIVFPNIKFSNKNSELLAKFNPDIVLIGTSYSVRPFNSIAVGIEQVLGSEILNLGRDGGGIWGSMDYYLGERKKNLVPASPKVIIWEIPERFINKQSIQTYHDFPNINKVLDNR
ncbi:alginate O-acetyltransferase AlgX-related protein [Deinococcus aquiradiocola]|uniref:AlgX/AlgJ SGNH hydrolase-like domain-containing protein n=1 Tax=Deinococcus aquiradiocola TaxID=393059 RepID=A0A917PGZ7_9DEIO|nr:hypothetical protein [Deinococcus aquiradiocola]GGJ77603.1 hypothetical protein GCM10008939_22060 [Deinococcus aquiradiocola]